jgi:hypothetical protein
MVRLGADICVAFICPCRKHPGRPADRGLPFHGSHGSVHCANFAEANGILTRRFTPTLAA